jgi:hypothetical protein
MSVGRASRLVLILSVAQVLAFIPSAALAGERWSAIDDDLYVLYQRLQPGMALPEVGAATRRERALDPGNPPTSWLLWTPPAGGRPTEVLRATFRDGRVVRIEYEAFGDEYRYLVKGERRAEMDGDQIARLWRRSTQVMQAAEDCGEALEAYHHLVVGLQERLTPAEQQAWVRALRLRREAEAGLDQLAR